MELPFTTIRHRLELSQKGLAERLGLCQAMISKYERGSVIHPTNAYKVIEIAAGMGVNLTLDDIYANHRPKPTGKRAARSRGR